MHLRKLACSFPAISCLKSRKFRQIFAALAAELTSNNPKATLSAFGMGTVEAYTSVALPDMANSTQLGGISDKEYAHVASLALLAAIVSAIPTGILLEKIGRKGTIILMAVPFVTGWLLIAFAVNIPMIDVGRVLTGFCAGSASMAVPVFLGELAEDSIRGFLGSSFQLQVTSGNLFVYILGKYMDWHWLALSSGIVVFIGLVLMIFVPPSPRFLLSKGRVQDATRSLRWLRGADTAEEVELELNDIQVAIEASTKDRQSFRDYFRLPIIRPMLISLFLLFFQQMTGVEAVLVYTLDIFQCSGSALDPHTSVIIVGSLQLVATFCSAMIVDKVGRRSLLLISSFGSASAMAILGSWFYRLRDDIADNCAISESTSHLRHDWVPLVTLGIFIVFFALGLGPIPFVMIAELNNSEMIGIASTFTTTFNWTFAFLVTRYFLSLARSLGFHILFWGFSGLSVIGFIFMSIFVPETKGKSMDEIQKYFRGEGTT